jgi:pimeloyl-ACP methyl ester carboxylesterase
MGKPAVAGYSTNGLPYVRSCTGDRILVVFDGLDFSHKPPSGMELMMSGYQKKFVAAGYAVYLLRRRPVLPPGYSIKDMADDYAVMIEKDIKKPVDIMGVSTGGTIAQWFAAEHPGLVRRLVLASTGYRLNDKGKALQLRVAGLAREGKCRAASAALAEGLGGGFFLPVAKTFMWLFAGVLIPGNKTSDGVIEIEAEDAFNFKSRLKEITCPTLVIGGDNDYFYGPIEDTAAGISSAKLVLYKGVGHGAIMKSEFSRDVLAFLNTE